MRNRMTDTEKAVVEAERIILKHGHPKDIPKHLRSLSSLALAVLDLDKTRKAAQKYNGVLDGRLMKLYGVLRQAQDAIQTLLNEAGGQKATNWATVNDACVAVSKALFQ